MFIWKCHEKENILLVKGNECEIQMKDAFPSFAAEDFIRNCQWFAAVETQKPYLNTQIYATKNSDVFFFARYFIAFSLRKVSLSQWSIYHDF